MHCEMISRSPRRFEACIKFPCGSDQENLPDRNPSCAALLQTGAAESQNRAALDVRLTTEDVSEFDRWFLPRPRSGRFSWCKFILDLDY